MSIVSINVVVHLGSKGGSGSDLSSDSPQVDEFNLIGVKLGGHLLALREF